jgi:hypothetical protein
MTGEDLLGFINDDPFPSLKELPAMASAPTAPAWCKPSYVVQAVLEDA